MPAGARQARSGEPASSMAGTSRSARRLATKSLSNCASP
jgi:hypothetical protein